MTRGQPQSIITIGNFDGVHLGHRAILSRARELSRRHGCPLTVMTFDPHPATVLRPDVAPPRLLGREQKLRRLRDAGADRVVVMRPTRQLLGQTPAAFIQSIVAEHRPLAVVEGEDFRFGKGRAGDLAGLREMGRELGFEVFVVPPAEVTLSDQTRTSVSSSLVRRLVGDGRMRDAARCLEAPFALAAPVVRGEQRGRTIGVPTANLDPAVLAGFVIPAHGVYAGVGCLEARDSQSANHDSTLSGRSHPAPTDAEQVSEYPAAISVGRKPTFHGRRLTIEAHLLDYPASSARPSKQSPDRFDAEALYGRVLTLTFGRWLREQASFSSVEALTAQMRQDIARTRRWREQGVLPFDGSNPPVQSADS